MQTLTHPTATRADANPHSRFSARTDARRLFNRSRLVHTVALTLLIGLGCSPAWAQDANHKAGEKVFMQSGCFGCHGQLGSGGVGPQFRGDRFLGITDYVAGQILLGRGIMPSFADKLDDEQIAAVASYIRNSWGNKFGDVQASEVTKVRKQVQLPPAKSASNNNAQSPSLFR